MVFGAPAWRPVEKALARAVDEGGMAGALPALAHGTRLLAR